MKKIFLLIFAINLLFSYKAKVIPYKEYRISSAVSGQVVFVDKNLEATEINNKLIVKIDDYQNRVDLNNLLLKKTILLKEKNNLQEIVNRKYEIYKRYENLKTKSKLEKDLKFFDYINSLNQLLNLNITLSDIDANIKKLNDIIAKKSIKASGYLVSILVDEGDYVMPGKLIAKVDDISKQKLYVYIPIDKNIENKKVYIDGRKTNFKFKVFKVADENYITSYKVEIITTNLKVGKVVDVSFK